VQSSIQETEVFGDKYVYTIDLPGRLLVRSFEYTSRGTSFIDARVTTGTQV